MEFFSTAFGGQVIPATYLLLANHNLNSDMWPWKILRTESRATRVHYE